MGQLAELLAGTLIGERYQLGEQIGRGGMGAVYKARQVAMDTVVALKFVDQSVSQEAVSRFGQEAKALAALNHPNIVKVLSVDIDRATQRCYMAMELVEGTSLDDFLERNGELTCDQFRSFFSQIADALGYAHSRGVVHRDIKPSNILICSDNETVKIVDFGLAKILQTEQSITSTGAIIGTPNYMSPEQCGKGGIDGRSDIYSLGCVMWRTLSNEIPFADESSWAVLCRQLSEALPVITDDRYADFAGVIKCATEKDPSKRYQTMGDLKQAIIHGERLARGATAAGAPKPTRLPKPTIIVAAGLSISLLVIYAFFAALTQQRKEVAQEQHLAVQLTRLLEDPNWMPSDLDLKNFGDAAKRNPQSAGEDAAQVFVRVGHDDLAKEYLRGALSGRDNWHEWTVRQLIQHFERKRDFEFAAEMWGAMGQWKHDRLIYRNEADDWLRSGNKEAAEKARLKATAVVAGVQPTEGPVAPLQRMLKLVNTEIVSGGTARKSAEPALRPLDIEEKLKNPNYQGLQVPSPARRPRRLSHRHA